MSGIVNKAKEVIHNVTHPDNKTHTTTTGTAATTSGVPEGTAGPHGSRVANAADPRVGEYRRQLCASFVTDLARL